METLYPRTSLLKRYLSLKNLKRVPPLCCINLFTFSIHLGLLVSVMLNLVHLKQSAAARPRPRPVSSTAAPMMMDYSTVPSLCLHINAPPSTNHGLGGQAKLYHEPYPLYLCLALGSHIKAPASPFFHSFIFFF